MKTFDFNKEFKFNSVHQGAFAQAMKNEGIPIFFNYTFEFCTVGGSPNRKRIPFPKEWRHGGKTFGEVKEYLISKYYNE